MDLTPGLLIGIPVGVAMAIIGLVVWAIIDLVMPRKFCPDCKAPFPKISFSAMWREAWKGTMICKKCGCEFHPAGGKIRSGSTMSD